MARIAPPEAAQLIADKPMLGLGAGALDGVRRIYLSPDDVWLPSALTRAGLELGLPVTLGAMLGLVFLVLLFALNACGRVRDWTFAASGAAGLQAALVAGLYSDAPIRMESLLFIDRTRSARHRPIDGPGRGAAVMRSEEIEFQRFDGVTSPLSGAWRSVVLALTAGSALLAGADAAGLLANRYLPASAREAAPWRARTWTSDGAALEDRALISSGLSLAPLDGAGWLALARLDLRSSATRDDLARGLKALSLAFDTAPHAANVLRTRLALTVIGPEDQALALAVGRDLRSLFATSKSPQTLMDSLYALAGTEGRKLLEALPLRGVTVPSAAPTAATPPATASAQPPQQAPGKSKTTGKARR